MPRLQPAPLRAVFTQFAPALAIGLCALLNVSASAQEPAANTATNQSERGATHDAQGNVLEEVVVRASYTTTDRLNSATGLGLSIRETPQSVSVMTFQRIEDQNLNSLTDVVLNATGVSSKELDSSRATFSARGFAIDNYQLDGVPIGWTPGGEAGESQTDMSLYERVEIVRGATGLLTGAGNPSAAINLVRKHADSRELTGTVSASASRWDNYDATADVSAPVTGDGSVRARGVLRYADGDSYVDLLGNTKTVAYGTVDADLGPGTLLRGGASYQDNDPTASTWGGLPAWYSDGTRTDWPDSKTIGADWTRWASNVTNYFASVNHEFANGWTGSIEYNRAQNDADLHLLYLYGTPDRETGLGLGPSPYNSETSREQDSVFGNLKGSFNLLGREHEAVLGYQWSDQTETTDTFPVLGDPAPVGNFNVWDGSYPEPAWGSRTRDIKLDRDQTGIYTATRLSLTDEANLVLGGRLADWQTKGLSYGSSVDYEDNNVFIPYAGALYDVLEDHTVYASYTEIFQPQSELDRNGRQLESIVGKGYETGLKSSFFGGSLNTTIALFRIEEDNLAQPDPGFLVPGTIFEASRATEGATSEGFELELVGAITPDWIISASYTDFNAEDADNVDFNPDQPRKMFKLFTTYALSGELRDLTVGGGINWEDSTYTPTVNPVTGEAEDLTQDDYTLVNLMARYDFTPQLSAQVNVSNLLDETYYSQIGFYDQLAFGMPRNITGELRYRF
jgi:outer-membrane receptor for ferric coprogen and ferric-rhodotorulic acid